MSKNTLFNFGFLSLCMVAFLALCNVASFYNLHVYLQRLGFNGKEAGFLIGLYSLTAMVLYLFASKHITLKNAFTCMCAGVLIVASCGITYLFAKDFLSLAILRIANGAGIFLLMASVMVTLISIIPPQNTGLAFSIYSVALLLPYSIMPAVSELVLPFTDTPTKIYMTTAILLLPAIGILSNLRNRIENQSPNSIIKKGETPRLGGERKNLCQKPVISILLVNGVYFIIFSALFFLFKGFALQRGIKNPGFFFTVQMGVMVAIRLVGGQLFDRISKLTLVVTAMLLTGVGFWLLWIVIDTAWIPLIAAVFGLGMGLCVPPLNSLMYLVSHPQYRGYNANMMMLSIHFGTFMGPFFGAWIIDAGGYDWFLFSAILITVSAAGFFLIVNPEKYVKAFTPSF